MSPLSPAEAGELIELERRIAEMEEQLNRLSETIDPRSDELIMLTEVYDGLVMRFMELMARKQ